MRPFQRGQIWLVNFDPSVGHEYKKVRLALIIQHDRYIPLSTLVTVIPLSSQTAKQAALDVLIKKDIQNRLMKDSLLRFLAVVLFLGLCVLGSCNTSETGSGEDTHIEEALGEQIRILPLGDSITQGAAGYNSYRRNLYHKLVDAGYKVNFVGSMTRVWDNVMPPNPDYDLSHEGHWGWRADEILNGRFWQITAGKLSKWLESYTPDIVLIHIGTNDLGRAQDSENTISEIKSIITTLRADNPEVVIFLAKLIPLNNETMNSRILPLNEQMDEMAAEISSAQSPVFVVDQYNGFDAVSDTFDGVHPNQQGEEKMAVNWFKALNSYLSSRPRGRDGTPTKSETHVSVSTVVKILNNQKK